MTRVHGYRIGKWYGLLSSQWVGLLPPSCGATEVGRSWLSAQDLSGPELIEAVTTQIAARQEPFALVEFSPDGDTQVHVRGPVQVVLRQGNDRRTVTGGTQTVSEKISGVSLVELRAPGAITSGPPLPLGGGVVRVETISVSLGAQVVSAEIYQEVEAAARAQQARGTAAVTTAPNPTVARRPQLANSFAAADLAIIAESVASESADVAAQWSAPIDEDDHTVLAPTLGLLNAEVEEDDHTILGPTLGLAGAGRGVDVDDHTVLSLTIDQLGGPGDDDDTLIPATAASTPLAAAHPGADTDHDGETILSSDLPALRAQMSTNTSVDVVGDAPQIRVTGPRTVVLSTGQVIALNRPVLIGRSPSVSRVSASTMPRLVSVPSPKQDISRTHVEIRQDGDVVLVTDLSSTNGTILHVPGLSPRRLYPGMPTLMENDDVVDLGDGVTIRIEA